jgi:hypothetical protein
MSNPGVYNFPDHYKGDGLSSFKITLEYASGTPVVLEGSEVLMQMRNSLRVLLWTFSSNETGDNMLTILPNGVIQFPRIASWDIPSTKYYYDLQVIDATGFIRTYLTGTWRVNLDITK